MFEREGVPADPAETRQTETRQTETGQGRTGQAEAVQVQLDGIAAGPQLLAALAALDLSAVDRGVRVDALVAWGRLVAHVQAGLMAAMTAVAGGSVGVGFDSDEVAFALCLSRLDAGEKVGLARDLINRLPAVYASFAAGRIDLGRAKVFSIVLARLDDSGLARAIADRLLPLSEEWTAPQLRRKLLAEVAKADPDAARRQYERSIAERRVSLTSNPDTTAHLEGVFLPPHKACAAFEHVDALARGLRNAGDERTLDQLRADVFCDLLAGTLPTEAQAVHRPGVVEMVVPLATLTGQSDEPAAFAGYGPVIADVARQVAEQARQAGSGYQWRFRVYNDEGTLLYAGTTRVRPGPCPPKQADESARFPSHVLKRWISARDDTCRAPGCTAPARSSDYDHTVDHKKGGKTRHDNLGMLCRHHHRLKHEGGFELEQPEPGRFIWRSPSGKIYRTDPDPPW